MRFNTAFLTTASQKFGLPRLIITTLFLFVLALSFFLELPVSDYINVSLIRWGMFLILVLAMVPSIQSGTGPNFALPIGIVIGLLASLVSLELQIENHLVTFLLAIALSIIGAVGVGYFYGLLLNKVKGSEMTIATYTGFAIVSFLSIAWILLPFKNPALLWPLGEGLRNTITLDGSFGHILMDHINYPWQFIVIGEIEIPWFMLVVSFAICGIYWLFSKSKTGTQILAAGKNPQYAKSNGIDVDKSRIIANIISTVFAAVGIVIYSQGFSFVQLYTAPLYMAFPAVAAILIGGATAQRASVFHAILGTLLFQGLLAVSMPVANHLIPFANLSETLRLIIQNGIILYALTKVGSGGQKA